MTTEIQEIMLNYSVILRNLSLRASKLICIMINLCGKNNRLLKSLKCIFKKNYKNLST